MISRRGSIHPRRFPLARAFRRRPAAFILSLLSAGLVLAACEGTNAFSTPGGGGGGGGSADATAPTVTIAKPDSAANVAVGEQLYVEARVTDNVALVRPAGMVWRKEGTETKSTSAVAVPPIVRMS